MNLRQRRLTVAVAATVALASAAGAVVTYGRGASADAALPAPRAAVLSPRRVPEALSRLVADTRLASRVEALMKSLSPTSCAVVRADDSTLLAYQPDELLMPASALKLTTAAAFLAKAGGKGRFETTVRYPARAGDTVSSLTLTGGGDPLLALSGYVESRKHPPKPATDFTKLVMKLHDAGIRHVAGDIVVNDAKFDAERRVPSWSAGYTATGDVGPIGALALDDGFSSFAPLVAAPDPAIAAGQELRAELVAAGVTVDGTVRRGDSDPKATNVVTLTSAPYAEVVREMLTDSDNNTAEILLKSLVGAPGATRTAGVAARATALRTLGVDPSTVQAIDGSGLDRSDRTTCATLLATLITEPGGYDIEDLLAVAGQTGTLDDRFLTSPLVNRLRAKTGSLDGVTALIGIADAKAIVKVRFAFISNGNFTDAGGKAQQDRLVAALATYPEAPDAAKLAP